MDIQEFFDKFEKASNSTDFDKVRPFIAEDAIYWFSNGSFVGISAIHEAFERTWNTIENETYTLSDIEWLGVTETFAVCIYRFHSQGFVKGKPYSANGRGTNVFSKIEGEWKIIHEHLSKLPEG